MFPADNNSSDEAACRHNYTILLLFINATNPDYFLYRLNDIIILLTLAVLGLLFNALMAWLLLRDQAFAQSANAFLALHLAIADVLVALFCMISDGAWNITMQWMGGNVLCKVVKFMQMFGLFATTLTLTGMSVERCITVIFPISKSGRHLTLRRSRTIAGFVWVIAGVCSIPQAIIFHVERAPICVDFYQCVTHGSYSSDQQELAYNMLILCLMFIVPLVVICVCYILIFASFTKEAQQALGDSDIRPQLLNPHARNGPKRGQRLYLKMRRISLWMTFFIAVTFVVCWTPYYMLTLAHLFKWSSPPATLASLYLFGMSNSVLNPIIFAGFRWVSAQPGNTRNNSYRPTVDTSEVATGLVRLTSAP
ncbi:gonadotropin-releasing hormone receptor-like [Paramacrobiotus metropolitanus]|uniref:gonadotropin-releasing hormone receptor-like n=1 Tax=Paramacrobiotus metropolitanus TaxID=2943436 RepID=UPI0024464E51|nr:gonadotropin-releasing hormone receptor-like [Paramacrobiotus metropolitanus]XP_055345612.1 gonadotropin-releasing hormone receptor-like [Paramacrobiotus metropolitanus]XP_055345614.1 gonadotropin-releasing hormone receptor-like [Paramacrobiotus metropolitanus]